MWRKTLTPYFCIFAATFREVTLFSVNIDSYYSEAPIGFMSVDLQISMQLHASICILPQKTCIYSLISRKCLLDKLSLLLDSTWVYRSQHNHA